VLWLQLAEKGNPPALQEGKKTPSSGKGRRNTEKGQSWQVGLEKGFAVIPSSERRESPI